MPIEYNLTKILNRISSKFFNVRQRFISNNNHFQSKFYKHFEIYNLNYNNLITGGKAVVISTICVTTAHHFINYINYTKCENDNFNIKNEDEDDDSIVVTFNENKNFFNNFESNLNKNFHPRDGNLDDEILVTHITRPVYGDDGISSNKIRSDNSEVPNIDTFGFINTLFGNDDGSLSTPSPKKVFFYTCGAVFMLWAIAENSKNVNLMRFMRRHFIASGESINDRRYYTLLTSGISHSSFLHLTFNMMMLNIILDDFSKSRGITNVDFSGIAKIFSNVIKGYGNFPAFNVNNTDYVTDFDIYTTFCLSTLGSSLAHALLYGTPVLGASGGISGLMFILATTNPNSTFKTIFPIPGIRMSSLQMMQIFIATNLFFILSKRFQTNIAWTAHVFGLGIGVIYCWIQRNIFDRQYFKSFLSLSSLYSKNQWAITFQEIKDSLKL